MFYSILSILNCNRTSQNKNKNPIIFDEIIYFLNALQQVRYVGIRAVKLFFGKKKTNKQHIILILCHLNVAVRAVNSVLCFISRLHELHAYCIVADSKQNCMRIYVQQCLLWIWRAVTVSGFPITYGISVAFDPSVPQCVTGAPQLRQVRCVRGSRRQSRGVRRHAAAFSSFQFLAESACCSFKYPRSHESYCTYAGS